MIFRASRWMEMPLMRIKDIKMMVLKKGRESTENSGIIEMCLRVIKSMFQRDERKSN